MKEDWDRRKIKEVADVIGGSTPKTNVEDYWGGDNYWVTPAELDGSKYIDKTVRCITAKAVEKTNLTLMPSGTVLLSSRAPIGKVCITKASMYCNQGFKNLVCKELLYNEFAYYFLKHNVDYLQSLGTGATFKEISKKVVENVVIPIPPLSEQQHIVKELDLLSSIIEKKKIQLNELDNLAQSLFYEMFGDPITNENGWEVKKIGEIGKVITGSTPSTKDEGNYNSCDYCFIKPSDIAKDNVTRLFESEFHISCKAYDNSRQLPKGSVLVMCIGIVGKVGILEVNATCNQQINAIVPYSFVQSRYLAYSILLQKKVIESIANAPVVPIINKKEFSLLSTPIPPLELQQQFASKIEAIEHQKELIKQSIKEVETLFNSRMDYYFN